MDKEKLKILIVDDDEDDYIITRDLLSEITDVQYDLDWVDTYDAALEQVEKKQHSVYFFDYRLGKHNGLELLRESIRKGCRAPIILLTGQGDHEIDLEALKSGAADYLLKNELRSSFLEHTIRYALERKRMEDELFQEKERAIVTLESIGDSVITTDTNGNITHLNQVAERITGWDNAEALGLSFHNVIKLIHEVTHRPAEDPVKKVLSQNTIINFPGQIMIVNRINGREFAIEGNASPIRNHENHIIGIVVVMHDVTSAREMSKKIAYQASHDPLTGLYNRAKFEEELQKMIDDVNSRSTEHILFYLDLDQFKIVNDTCGHFAGDQLLKQISIVMKDKIRHIDVFARLGGDEFGILLVNCPLAKACEIGEKICQAVRKFHFTWNDKLFSIGVSIGAVKINAEGNESIHHLLSVADQSCYMAKEKGGNRIHVYFDNDSEISKRRGEMQWISSITKGFEKDRFCLYYHPIVPIQNSNAQNRLEVLIRLLDDDGKITFPSSFLPAAQRYSMMPSIDRWVLDTFFSFYRKNFIEYPAGNPPICYINLSVASLNDEYFLQFIKEQFDRYKIPPQYICFEITETTAFASFNKAIQFMYELKNVGCLFALDDFGSGLSSFSYLKYLPVDFIKIDGIFVQSLPQNPVDCAMVESINQIGHMMNIQTIAEFVENEEILNRLKEIGIDYGQGFWFGKPKSLEYLKRTKSKP